MNPHAARMLCEYVGIKTELAIGKQVAHPDGRTVQIVGGQFWGTYGLSNHWQWREVLPSGELAEKVESGYGWM